MILSFLKDWMAWILHACMTGTVHSMLLKNQSVESLYSIECLLKVKKNMKDPSCYKVLAKMTLTYFSSTYLRFYFSRHYWTIPLPAILHQCHSRYDREKKSSCISYQVTANSAQQCRNSPLCFSRKCHWMWMEEGKEAAVRKLLGNKCDLHMTGTSHSSSSKVSNHLILVEWKVKECELT